MGQILGRPGIATSLVISKPWRRYQAMFRSLEDFRRTFSTWLEDAGIPARVIDELMGHEATGRGGQRGSAMGAHYRHTTPEMAARVLDAMQRRLTLVIEVSERMLDNRPNWSAPSAL